MSVDPYRAARQFERMVFPSGSMEHPSNHVSVSAPRPVATGWQCPGCGRCFAPGMPQCTACGPKDAAPQEITPDYQPPCSGGSITVRPQGVDGDALTAYPPYGLTVGAGVAPLTVGVGVAPLTVGARPPWDDHLTGVMAVAINAECAVYHPLNGTLPVMDAPAGPYAFAADGGEDTRE